MQCEKVKKLISEYIDGELSPKITHEIKEHLAKCEKCDVLANTMKATVLFSHEQALMLVERMESPISEPQSIYYSIHKILRKEWEFHTGTKALKIRVGQLDAPQQMYANLIEQNNTLILIIELPGVRKENIQLMVGTSSVEISGFKEKAGRGESLAKEETCYINEIKCGEFFREIELPCQIVPERTKSSLKNGLLRIKMFKA